MEHILQIRNHHGYSLHDFHNRASAYIPWKGLNDDLDRKFTKFDSPDLEKLNFVHSKLGDMASPIDENYEYAIYGVKQYLIVRKCVSFKKERKCSEDHHLQTILNDIAMCKNFNREVTTRDIDISRDFHLVTQNPLPIFNKHNVSTENLFEPNLILVPNQESTARILTFTKMQLSDEHFRSMNVNFYPNGELTGDPTNSFNFRLMESTPEGSAIVKICLILNYLKTDIFKALERLMTSGEPKELVFEGNLVQTVRHGTYALFCLYQNMRLKRKVELDSLFDFQHLNLKFFNINEFGRVKMALVPFGLIASFIRLHVESQIMQAKCRLVSNMRQNPIEGLILKDDNISLRKENTGIVDLIKSQFFLH